MQITLGRVATGLGLAATFALVVWSLMPKPVPVEIATVRKGTFVATVDEDGKTRVRERYVVAAPLAGRLVRVRLKAGDSVKAEEVVATIQPALAPFLDPRARHETEHRLEMAEATRERTKALVERAKVQAQQAKADLDRARKLAQSGSGTVQTLERAETGTRVAERDLRAAEFQDIATAHEIEQGKALLERYADSQGTALDQWNVTAPVSGLVLKVAQESETPVQPGTPILDIGDRRDLEIIVDVLSTDAVEIHPGAAVAIEHWGGPGELAGRVRRVEPAAFTKISTLGVEEQRVNVLIDMASPPQDWTGLGDAFQVDARITVFTRDNTVIVPSGALFRSNEGWNVYVVRDGRAQRQGVELLRRAGRFAAVTAGVEPGDKVIVYPSDRIAAGVRVEPR